MQISGLLLCGVFTRVLALSSQCKDNAVLEALNEHRKTAAPYCDNYKSAKKPSYLKQYTKSQIGVGCACFKKQASTTTTTKTKTKTSKTSTTTSTTTSSAQPTPTGPYYPDLPYSYQSCYTYPDPPAQFNFLNVDSGMPIISVNGLAQVSTDIDNDAPLFSFQSVYGAPYGVWDIVLIQGNSTSYFAFFDDGTVGFASQSSNGQTYTSDGSSSKFVTTVWTLLCDGSLSAGIEGSYPLPTYLTANTVLSKLPSGSTGSLMTIFAYDTSHGKLGETYQGLTKRIDYDHEDPRCPNENQDSNVKPDARPPGSNGCGPGWANHIADFDFTDCCNGHDLCYDDCSKTWTQCNGDFGDCMSRTCDQQHQNTITNWGCHNIANGYHGVVDSNLGRDRFNAANSDRCQCDCKFPGQNPCGCNNGNYADSPLFRETCPFGSPQWSDCKACCSAWVEAENNGGSCACCVFQWQYDDPSNGCCSHELSDKCCRVGCGV